MLAPLTVLKVPTLAPLTAYFWSAPVPKKAQGPTMVFTSGATVVEDGESIGAAAARVAQQHAESIALAYARLVAQRDRADDEDDAS